MATTVAESVRRLGPPLPELTEAVALEKAALEKMRLGQLYTGSGVGTAAYEAAACRYPWEGSEPVPHHALWSSGGHRVVADFARSKVLPKEAAASRLREGVPRDSTAIRRSVAPRRATAEEAQLPAPSKPWFGLKPVRASHAGVTELGGQKTPPPVADSRCDRGRCRRHGRWRSGGARAYTSSA